jgi:hypothetical protein
MAEPMICPLELMPQAPEPIHANGARAYSRIDGVPDRGEESRIYQRRADAEQKCATAPDDVHVPWAQAPIARASPWRGGYE